MKTVTYTCDNCEKESENIDNWISIGSEDGKNLRIENNLPNPKLIECANHQDMHFCCPQCFVGSFLTKIEFTNLNSNNL